MHILTVLKAILQGQKSFPGYTDTHFIIDTLKGAITMSLQHCIEKWVCFWSVSAQEGVEEGLASLMTAFIIQDHSIPLIYDLLIGSIFHLAQRVIKVKHTCSLSTLVESLLLN